MTIYNPHLLARQELVETFVARQPLLDELVDDLRRGGKQHHLLVGGRGSGKTTLLLRLATAIEDSKSLAKRCIPLRFPEEQYNVSRTSDLWMNAVDALADALEREDNRAAAKHLESSRDELEPLDEAERSQRSLALLQDWAKRTKRLLVLLVDNLDLVLDRLSESLWELREALSLDNRLVLIGASSRFVEEAIDYQSPFYDFFRVHELEPLSEDEARAIVLSLARRANTPNVAAVLERDPARFKALFDLTGGTPRTLALLHTVLALDRHDSIERDLESLLDQLTPYYKARFDDLPSQSQVIVDKVALHWHPITAAKCQVETHLDVNVVSAQLNRLTKNGILAKVSLPGPSKLGFQLNERFFNIWYLMRASRRLRRRLSWLVEFLRICYGEEELRRRAEQLISAAPLETRSSPARFLAFATAITDKALRRRLEFRAIGLLTEEGVTAIREIMDLEGEDAHLAPVVDRVHALKEIRTQIACAKVQWRSGVTPEAVADAIAGYPTMNIELKQRIANAIYNNGFSNIYRFLDRPDYEITYGVRLLNAIASGELPSVLDITTTDMRPFLELAKNTASVAGDILFYNEEVGTPLTDEMIQELIHSRDAWPGIPNAAYALVSNGNWTRAREILLPLLQSPGIIPELWMFLTFFSCCVNQNCVVEAIHLLEDADLVGPWAPVYEALGAIEAGDISLLDALAPEMRKVALALFEIFTKLKADAQRQGGEASDVVSSSTSVPVALHKGRRRRPDARRKAFTRRERFSGSIWLIEPPSPPPAPAQAPAARRRGRPAAAAGRAAARPGGSGAPARPAGSPGAAGGSRGSRRG